VHPSPVHPSLLHPPTPQARRSLVAATSGADRPDPGGDALDPLLLAEIAAGLAQSLPAKAATVPAGPQLLLETRRYMAWALTWPAGAAWDCRDHHPGVMHVVRGELVERWTDLLHLDSAERTVRAGDAIALGGSLASHIENRGPQAAVVVHVTSRPATAPSPCERTLRLVS
jgi:hypothetical protein